MLLSSLHKNGKIDESTGKPEIVMFYNSTKDGTDTFDQLCKSYTTARITNRWPMRFFYGLLDQAGINAFILFFLRHKNARMNRRDFLKELVLSLVKPSLERRLTVRTLKSNLKQNIKEILGFETTTSFNPNTTIKRKKCSVSLR